MNRYALLYVVLLIGALYLGTTIAGLVMQAQDEPRAIELRALVKGDGPPEFRTVRITIEPR